MDISTWEMKGTVIVDAVNLNDAARRLYDLGFTITAGPFFCERDIYNDEAEGCTFIAYVHISETSLQGIRDDADKQEARKGIGWSLGPIMDYHKLPGGSLDPARK